MVPNISGRVGAWALLTISLAIKWVGGLFPDIPVYMIASVQKNVFWFVLGMAMQFWKYPEKCKKIEMKAAILVSIFLVGSIAAYMRQRDSFIVTTGMGVLGCMAVVSCCTAAENCKYAQIIGNKFTGYTMPVFLMHTIFAAGTRTILFKLGISNLTIHIVAGIVASFIGPVFAFKVMRYLKLDILINPEKYKNHHLREMRQV